MTQDIDFKTDLAPLAAPAPREGLRAQILAEAMATAQTPVAANDRRFNIKSIMAAAACLAVMAFVGVQSLGPSEVTDEWKVAAVDTGFAEIYDWVHAEDGS